MTLSNLIRLMENRLAYQNNALATATTRGDLDEVVRLQAEVDATQQTLDQLRSLT
jgi:hypothetical protein